MSIKLEDYEEFLSEAAPEIRDILEGSFQEASRVMSPAGLQQYMDAAKSLCNLGRGSGVVISYLQEMPLVAKECGEDVIGDCLTAAMKLSSMTSGEVVALLFGSMPTAARNLGDAELFRGYAHVLAMPAFLVGSLFLYVFAVQLNWIPAAFNAVDLSRLDTLETIAFFFTALIFPCLTIAAETVAHVLRQTRASMIEEMKSNYVRAALLRGVPRRRVILGHVLRNSLLPAITVIAINVGYVFGGVIVVEFVFSYPGIGNLMLSAILTRDVPIMLGTMFVISAGYVLANFVADILYSALNPRVRLT